MINDKSNCDKVLGFFGHESKGSLKINHSNFDCENCQKAFLAGAFLSCGTVSDPNKDYHLEFTVPFLNLSKSLVTLLGEIDFSPKTANRKGYNIVYFKDSEAIEDCLYIMGASSSMFDMMNVEIVKDLRNKANRTANCEAANIERTVKASREQSAAIEKIEEKKGLDFLKPDLKDMALLRQENPEASLAELSKISGLSRSGVNHRLKKIVEPEPFHHQLQETDRTGRRSAEKGRYRSCQGSLPQQARSGRIDLLSGSGSLQPGFGQCRESRRFLRFGTDRPHGVGLELDRSVHRT